VTTLRDERGYASAAIFASLLLHLLLAWCVLRHVVDVTPAPRFISVVLVRPQPIPKPKPPVIKKVAPSAAPVPKPVAHAAPAPVIHVRPQVHAHQARPAPPVGHFGTSGAESGLGLDLGSPSGGNGQGSIGDFDDAVKQRIEAAKTYPPGIPYMWNECVVEYQVTVNQTGQLLSYKLYGCDDPFLDSAARAAILMASPFPVPPNFGGSQYTVFGSLVFKHH
jgi:outer membrane biosynthesis protein TonB